MNMQTRTMIVELELDVGDEAWPDDEVLRAAAVRTLEGVGLGTSPAVVIEEARVAELER
jgi:hypothetical protein